MKIKLLAIISFLLFSVPFSLQAQVPTPLARTHYIFFYASTDAEGYGDSYKEIAVSKIYKDDAQTHYLFKLLNLKNRALKDMEQELSNHKDFKKFNTDFSSTKEEAEAKMKRLIDEWKKDNTVVHQLNFKYENATGQEYPDEY